MSMMMCAEIAPLLPEYVRRRLPPAQEATVRAHLSACPACAAAYEEELAFTAMVRGTDTPAPALLMPSVMASVRAEPRQMPRFGVRPLDFVLAIGAASALGGLVLGLLSLWAISPIFADMFDLRALLAGGVTDRTITLVALWAVVGLTISLTATAGVHAAMSRNRNATVWWSRL
jgi:anti-sigma factor RsiW